jgi:ribonuclease-3
MQEDNTKDDNKTSSFQAAKPQVKIDDAKFRDFSNKAFGFEFTTMSYLITALTHRSYLNEHKRSADEHNERLEFLGDAVLELIVTEYLYTNFSEPEGILTAWRSALVRTESLAEASKLLGVWDIIRMSRGERRSDSLRAKQQILANTFEALLGALYLEAGFEACKKFVQENVIVTLEEILKSGSWRDPKSYLQELTQLIDNETPVYKLKEEVGPDHDKLFKVAVVVGNEIKAEGQGASKQLAQQEAAKKALPGYIKLKDEQPAKS